MLNFVFLITSLSTTPFNFSSLQEQFSIYQHLNHLLLFLKLLKLVGTLVSLLMSSLSTAAVKAIKPFSAVKSDVPMPVACVNSFLAV